MQRQNAKSLSAPEQVRSFPNGRIEVVTIGETTIGRLVFEPGWHWSRDVAPIVGTRSCQVHHQGVVLTGRLHVESDAGEVSEFGVDDVYQIPAGHDAWVVGGERFQAIEILSARLFAVPADGDRILATVLFTDIVDSTRQASELGDRRWTDLLLAHHERSLRQIDRFHGRLVKNTGDGILATFDGPARAVRCASAIRDALVGLGLQVRAGLHTGEIEMNGDDIGGIAVHIAARVETVARPGEVLVSRTVVDLVAGSGLDFEDRGEHDLKGVPGSWRLFAVAG